MPRRPLAHTLTTPASLLVWAPLLLTTLMLLARAGPGPVLLGLLATAVGALLAWLPG